MLWLRRVACLAYWAFLTVLLLVPHPLALLGLKRSPWVLPEDRGVHFLLFLVLTLLVDTCRWAIRPLWFFLMLVGYALAMELLQALVPPRTVELFDLIENLSGIAVGTAIYWAAQQRPKGPDPPQQEGLS
ncbi:MAG: VanZ family protein [Thermoguttaceae bacterium]